jgi:hypothetical protein
MRSSESTITSQPPLPALWLMMCLALGCQARSGDSSTETAAQDLSVEQAQAIVAEERARSGLPTQPGPAPTSLADVFSIMLRDESDRFEPARDYLAPLTGVDVLVVRAGLEALWAEGLLTVAAASGERAERKKAELTAIKEEQRARPNDEALTKRQTQTQAEIEREQRLAHALKVLAKSHYYTGESLAQEVQRRNPERPEGYSVLANLLRLHRDWNEFESNMQKAQARSEERVGMLYARAMERAARLGDRPGARAELEAILAEHPDFARARAQLVLLQDDVEQRYQQLQQLKAVNPKHALIVLQGREIEQEYQTSRALRSAAEQQGEPPALATPPAASP